MIFSLFFLSIYNKLKNRNCLFSSECVDVFNNNKINNNTGKENVLDQYYYTKNLPMLSNNNKTGLDERFLHLEEDFDILNKVEKYYYKMEILQFLQNNSNNILEKMRLFEYLNFEKESSLLTDYTQGGLFHEWDTEIF